MFSMSKITRRSLGLPMLVGALLAGLVAGPAVAEIIADPAQQQILRLTEPSCASLQIDEGFGETTNVAIRVEVDEFCPYMEQLTRDARQDETGEEKPCPPSTHFEFACPVIRLALAVDVAEAAGWQDGEGLPPGPIVPAPGRIFWWSPDYKCWGEFYPPVASCVPDFWSEKIEAILDHHAFGVPLHPLCEVAPDACEDPIDVPRLDEPLPVPPRPRPPGPPL